MTKFQKKKKLVKVEMSALGCYILLVIIGIWTSTSNYVSQPEDGNISINMWPYTV